MIRFLIRTAIMLLANAIGLIVASLVVSGISITGLSFVVAVIVFTVIEALADPLLSRMAEKSVPALRGGVALIATFIGLLITTLVSSGLSITGGAKTWILGTLIVWLAALLAGLIIPIFLVKKAADKRND